MNKEETLEVLMAQMESLQAEISERQALLDEMKRKSIIYFLRLCAEI